VSQLASTFSSLTSERLGKKWFQHFEAWLFGRRAWSATPTAAATTCKHGARSTAISAWDIILPAREVDELTAADVELKRKLVKAGTAMHLADSIVAELCRLPSRLAKKV
jgi:hypothetical protein